MSTEDTSFFSKKKAQKLADKITIAWFVLFSFNSLCSSIIGALAGKYWSEIDIQDQFIICVAILLQWTGVIMAFLYQAVQKVSHGGNPLIGTADAATVTTTTETVVKPPTDK